MDFDFKPSPHKPLVIMDGHSEAGRVYLHDGVRSPERCEEIQRLWMVAPELYEALLVTMQRLDSRNHDSFDGVWTEEDFSEQTKEARAALAKARGEQS